VPRGALFAPQLDPSGGGCPSTYFLSTLRGLKPKEKLVGDFENEKINNQTIKSPRETSLKEVKHSTKVS